MYCVKLADPRAPVDNRTLILTATVVPALVAACCCLVLMLVSYVTCWMIGIGYDEFDTRKRVPKKMSA